LKYLDVSCLDAKVPFVHLEDIFRFMFLRGSGSLRG
jgi:hypothetical protein